MYVFGSVVEIERNSEYLKKGAKISIVFEKKAAGQKRIYINN